MHRSVRFRRVDTFCFKPKKKNFLTKIKGRGEFKEEQKRKIQRKQTQQKNSNLKNRKEPVWLNRKFHYEEQKFQNNISTKSFKLFTSIKLFTKCTNISKKSFNLFQFHGQIWAFCWSSASSLKLFVYVKALHFGQIWAFSFADLNMQLCGWVVDICQRGWEPSLSRCQVHDPTLQPLPVAEW